MVKPPQDAPPRNAWLSALVGLAAFLACFAFGIVLAFVVAISIPPDVPHPTEAYEGIGDYFRAQAILVFGALVSFPLSAMAGIFAAGRFRGENLVARFSPQPPKGVL